MPGLHGCTSEHEQGFAAGMEVSWHHIWAVCCGFHVTVLGKLLLQWHHWPSMEGSRVQRAWNPLPSDVECGWGLWEWLAGEPGFEIECLHQLLQPPLPLSYFSLHPFSLETNHPMLKAQPGSRGVGWPTCDSTSELQRAAILAPALCLVELSAP